MRDIFDILLNIARWIEVVVFIVIAASLFTVMALAAIIVILVMRACDGLCTMYRHISDRIEESRENKKENND